MGLHGHAALLRLVLVALLFAGCGGSNGPNTGGHYTLHIEVTSSGSPLEFRGLVSPNNGPAVPISGTTPFFLDIRDKQESCAQGQGSIVDITCSTVVSASVTKLTKSG